MQKKLFLVFLSAFIGQLLPAYAYYFPSQLYTSAEAKENTLQTKFLHHPSSELDLVHCQVSTAVRVIPVQKDSASDIQSTARINGSEVFQYTLHSYSSTNFSKNYIDHIYPSHHFW